METIPNFVYSLYETSKMMYNKNIILEVLIMPRYKNSPEERAAEKERKVELSRIVQSKKHPKFLIDYCAVCRLQSL